MPPIPLSHLVGPSEPERKYRLLETVRLRMRERRYSPRTEDAYVRWIRRFILYHDRRHPRDLGPEEVRAFLSSLTLSDQVAASTQNQALAAITFLYNQVLGIPLERIEGIAPARRSAYVPVVLSTREIREVLERLSHPTRLAVELLYGSGLRLMECVTLRVKDVDFDRREIIVRGGKEVRIDALHLPTRVWRVSRSTSSRCAVSTRAIARPALAVPGLHRPCCESIPTPTRHGHGGTCSRPRAPTSTRPECAAATISMKPSFSVV